MAEKKTPRLRMKKPEDIRRTLVKISNMVLSGELDSKSANSIISACNAILSAIRTDEQQEKIDYLQQLIKEMDKDGKFGDR